MKTTHYQPFAQKKLVQVQGNTANAFPQHRVSLRSGEFLQVPLVIGLLRASTELICVFQADSAAGMANRYPTHGSVSRYLGFEGTGSTFLRN